jgi:hypothetical protein
MPFEYILTCHFIFYLKWIIQKNLKNRTSKGAALNSLIYDCYEKSYSNIYLAAFGLPAKLYCKPIVNVRGAAGVKVVRSVTALPREAL